jgi:hypothetical protein
MNRIDFEYFLAEKDSIKLYKPWIRSILNTFWPKRLDETLQALDWIDFEYFLAKNDLIKLKKLWIGSISNIFGPKTIQ